VLCSVVLTSLKTAREITHKGQRIGFRDIPRRRRDYEFAGFDPAVRAERLYTWSTATPLDVWPGDEKADVR
jgi:hypothetical protein